MTTLLKTLLVVATLAVLPKAAEAHGRQGWGRREHVERVVETVRRQHLVAAALQQLLNVHEPRAVRIRVHAVPRRGAPWSQKPELFIVSKNLRAQPRGARQCSDRQRFSAHPLTLQCL